MKTINQISKEHRIPKTTLIGRIRKNNLKVLKSANVLLLNREQEQIIIKPIQHQYKGMINRNLNRLLVWQYKLDNPLLSAFEIANLLAIDVIDVDVILLNNELILESKINL
jgi:hypothetical protein